MDIHSKTRKTRKAFPWLLGLILVGLLKPAASSMAAVVVLDRITSQDTPVWLTVVTKGMLFAQGGQRVDVTVDNQALGRILTGGDGYGYLKYTPQRTGLLRIEARSNSDSASGLLLVTAPEDKVILIGMEGSFKNALFSAQAKSEAKKAIETLAKTFKIVYLSKLAGKRMASFWLQQEEFPDSVVLRWSGSELLKSLTKKGITLHAIVASPDILSDSVKYVERRFSFEETDDGQTVGDWAEIIQLLKPQEDVHDVQPPERSLLPWPYSP